MYLNKNRFNFYTRRLIWLAVSSIIRKVVDSLSFKASKYKDLTFTIKHCYETISILTCLIVCTARGFSDIKSTVCILYWILCNALAEVPIYHCHVACSTPTHTPALRISLQTKFLPPTLHTLYCIPICYVSALLRKSLQFAFLKMTFHLGDKLPHCVHCIGHRSDHMCECVWRRMCIVYGTQGHIC